MQTKDIREKILNFMREESYAPMTSEELVDALGHDVNPNKFWDELLALEQNGEIIKTRFATYGLPEKMGLVAGRFQLTSKGFGFVIPHSGNRVAHVHRSQRYRYPRPIPYRSCSHQRYRRHYRP